MDKKGVRNFLFNFSLFRKFYNNGYAAVDIRILFLNFLFQRVFRISSKANFSVNYKSTIVNGQNITYKKYTPKSFAIAPYLYIDATNGVDFGESVLIGPNVSIISSNHDFKERSKFVPEEPIQIGDNVWIGANVVILPGVEIGDNSIIGAGSIVTKNVEKNIIVAGNPAKKITSLTD